jgi:SAM-dependent methyltransferase
MLPPLGVGLGYVVGKLELTSESFDVVLTLDVLEHLEDDAAGLREAARLVKPGGVLLVTVPALPRLWGGQDVVSHHRQPSHNLWHLRGEPVDQPKAAGIPMTSRLRFITTSLELTRRENGKSLVGVVQENQS